MALSTLKTIPKDKDKGLLTIDLSPLGGKGAGLRFREPKAADLYPDAKELNAVKIAFAEFPDSMIYQIYLLGRCYVPDQADTEEESPMRAFGNLARTSTATFMHITSEFSNTFPTDDLLNRVKQAKNASKV